MPQRSKRRSVPDFVRRGLRQGLGVGALVAVGYEVVEPFGESSKTANQWLTCFKWAAISLIVLTAPVLGKVTQVSFERTIGTLAGGLLGLTTVLLGRDMMQATDQAFTAVISGLVGFGSVWAGHRLGLEYAGRLLAMTFILVVIGADGRADAFLVALTRCSGILLGVFLSVVLAVVVFPKSASHQATDNLSEALSGLCRLSSIAWNATNLSEPEGSSSSGEKDVYVALGDGAGGGAPAESKEVECEKALMDVYNNLSKVDEYLPLAKRERYMMTFRGRWCFLPSIPYLNLSSWTIPAAPMQELATAIRKVSRVLWALNVTFKEGFEEEVLAVLRRRYPAEMLAELQNRSHAALTDIADAFPDDTILPNTNLNKFLQVVEDLIRISDEQRRLVMRIVGTQGGLPTSVDSNRVPDSLSLDLKGASSLLDIQANASKNALAHQRLLGLNGAHLAISTESPQGTPQGVPEIEFGDIGSPTLAAQKVDVFPQTPEGYISKIRWFSFQFLMQQLAEGLQGMQGSTAIVLKMLPNSLEARHI